MVHELVEILSEDVDPTFKFIKTPLQRKQLSEYKQKVCSELEFDQKISTTLDFFLERMFFDEKKAEFEETYGHFPQIVHTEQTLQNHCSLLRSLSQELEEVQNGNNSYFSHCHL